MADDKSTPEDQEQSMLDKALTAVSAAVKSAMPKSRRPKRKDPKEANVGTGIADQGKKIVGGRKRQIDKAIEDAGG